MKIAEDVNYLVFRKRIGLELNPSKDLAHPKKKRKATFL